MTRVCAAWCAACLVAAGAAAQRRAEAPSTSRIYVEPFPAGQDAEKLRNALVDQLRKVRGVTIASDPSAVDAKLSGDGAVWIKGYRSLNPRSGRFPSNGTAIFGGYLSVELTDIGGDTFWSYLVSENATEDVFVNLAKKIVKPLSDALQSRNGVTAATTTESRATLQGAGATFPAPIYNKWFAAYAHRGVAITYEAVGSEEGIRKLLSGDADFGACDHPDILRQLSGEHTGDYVIVPSVVGAVVPIVNLPGFSGEIVFTPETLAGIYLGRITKWSDPAMRQANRGQRLPDLDIIVVHRAEGSGTTYNWTDYLAKASREWQSRVGVSLSPTWPTGRAATGNEGVAKLVTEVPGAVGYVEFIYAVQSHIGYGRVKNRHGEAVAASLDSIATAANSAIATGGRPAPIIDSAAAGAYPIASFTWLAVPRRIADSDKRTALTDFLRWMLGPGQRQAAALGYLALPNAVAAQAAASLSEIR